MNSVKWIVVGLGLLAFWYTLYNLNLACDAHGGFERLSYDYGEPRYFRGAMCKDGTEISL